MKRFINENSLSIVLFALFFVTLVGLSITGYTHYNQELTAHGQAEVSMTRFLTSGTYIESIFENWESEFLQMGALVLLTIWFRQKGSKDSKKLRGPDKAEVKSKYSITKTPWPKKWDALKEALYANSLSLALFGLFFVSLALHALGGAAAYNQEAVQHGESTVTTWQYISTSQFWFESFQNWQSEFLSVGVLIVFTIFLRQRYSPESKPMGEPNAKTGG